MLRKIVLKILFYSDSLEIEINGKLIFSRLNLGRDPDIDEIVEITKWGHKVALCVVASGNNVSSGQVIPAHVPLQRGRGRPAQDGDH